MRVVGVRVHIRDVHRLLPHRDPSGGAVWTRAIRVQALVLDDLGRLADVGTHSEQLTVGEVEEAGVGLAQAGGHGDDLVEDRLQPKPRAAQGMEDVGHCVVAAAQVVELPSQLCDPGLVHAHSNVITSSRIRSPAQVTRSSPARTPGSAAQP